MDRREADYVIIGGGAAGCVVASRLSENPDHHVVLLEAGGRSDRFMVKLPVGSYTMLGKPKTDWMYLTEPDPSLLGRQSLWFAGKLLGGGSAINGMVYIRGSRSDYDSWEQRPRLHRLGLGQCPDLFHEVRRLRRRAEPVAFDRLDRLGLPTRVSIHPLSKAFVEACAEHGLRAVPDYCDGDIDGAFINLLTQRGGQRSSAARAFLEPAMRRPNLTVLTEALADKVLIEDGRAVGVQYRRGGQVQTVRWRGAKWWSAPAASSLRRS